MHCRRVFVVVVASGEGSLCGSNKKAGYCGGAL